jgi:hypothetical protein
MTRRKQGRKERCTPLTKASSNCSEGPVPETNLKELELLVPYPADEMRMWKISPRVNSPKNDDPSLWEPLHAEPTQMTTDALELLRE